MVNINVVTSILVPLLRLLNYPSKYPCDSYTSCLLFCLGHWRVTRVLVSLCVGPALIPPPQSVGYPRTLYRQPVRSIIQLLIWGYVTCIVKPKSKSTVLHPSGIRVVIIHPITFELALIHPRMLVKLAQNARKLVRDISILSCPCPWICLLSASCSWSPCPTCTSLGRHILNYLEVLY